jgi:hypothetical protein
MSNAPYDSCDGRPGKLELITRIELAGSRPTRRIVLPTG